MSTMDDLEDLFTIRLDGNKLQLYLKDVSQKIATNKGALQNIESQVGRNRAQLNEIGELRRKVIKVTDRMQSVDKENAEKVKKLEAIDERLPEELMGRIKRDLDQQISTSVRVNQMHDEINSMAKTVEANSKVSNMLQTEFDEYHKSTDHEIHHIKDYIDQQLGYVREKTNLIEKTRNENVGLKNTIQELTNKVSWLMKMVEENNMQAMRATAITGSEYGYGPGITPRTHNRSIRHQDAEDLNLLATPKGGGRRLGDRGTSGGSGSSGGDFLNSPDAFVDGLRSNTSGVDCKDEGGDDRKARNGDGNNGSSSEHDKDQNNSNNAGNDNNANANANATESSDSGSTSNGNDNNYNDNDDDTSATNDKGGGGNDDNTDNSNNDVDSDNMSTVENVRQKFSDGLMKAVAAGYGQSETRDSKDAAAASGVKRDETKEEQGVGEGGIASADQSSGSDTETKQSQKQLDQIRELQHMRSRRQQRLEQRNRRSSVPVNILSMDFRHHPEGESGDGLGPRPIAVPEEMKQELIDSALKIVASKYEKQLNSTHQQSKDMTARLDTLTGELSKVRKKVHSLEKENKTLKRELTDSVATAAAAIAVSNKEHMDLMSDKHYVKHDTRAKKGRISDSVRASIPQLAGRFQINIVDENHGIDAVKKVEENEGTSEYIGAQIHTSSSSGTERVLISRTAANASSDTASKMSRNENKSTHSSNETDGNGLTPHGILNSSLRDYVDLQFNDMRHRLSEVTKQIITQAGGLNASALESVSVSENVSIHKYSLHKFNAETAALPLNRNLSWQKQLAAHRRQYNQQTSALSARISKLEQSYAFIQGDELSTRLNRVRNQVKFLAQELNLGHGHVLSSLLLKGDGKDSLHKKAIPVVTKTASSGTIVGSQMLVARGQPMLVGGNDGGVYKGRQGGTVFFSSTSNNRAVPSLGNKFTVGFKNPFDTSPTYIDKPQSKHQHFHDSNSGNSSNERQISTAGKDLSKSTPLHMPSSTTGRVGTAPNAKTVAFHTHQFNDIEQPVKAKPFVKGKKTDDVEFTIVTAASNAVNDTEHNEGHNATSDAMSPPDAAIGATRAADVSRSEKDKALVHTVPSGGGAGSMNSHAINYTLPTLTNKSPAAIESAQKQGVLIGQQMGRSSFSSSSLSSTASIPSSSRKTTSAEGKRSRAIKGGSRTARSVRKHNYKYKHAHTDHYTSVKYNNNNNDNHSKANQYNAELETDRAAVRRFHNRPRPRSIQPGQSQGGRGRIGKKTFVHTQKYEHYNIEKKHKNATSTHSDSSKSQHRKTVNRSTNSRSASNDNRDNVNGDVKKGEHQSNSGVHLESDVSVLRQQKGLRDAMVQGFLQKQEGSAHTTHSSGTHHPNRKRAPLVEEELVADGSSQDLNQKQRNDQDMDSKFSEEVEEEIINPQYNLSSW